MNIVIFGPPGAGKGTQSDFIVKKFKLHQLSTGQLLRNEIKHKTELGQKISSIMNSGQLVSDEIVSDIIEKFISKNEFKDRIIFDGYPRNLIQAKNLNDLLKKHHQKINLVLKLSVTLDTIKKRITGRSVCSICGKIYNEFFNPAPINAECCASKFLQKRSDDTLEIAIKRYETYEKNIEPVINFYKDYDLLKIIKGEAPITEISNEISDILKGLKGWLYDFTQYKYARFYNHWFMARIAGINIPQNKVVSIALTYIHGIGLHSSKKICKKLEIPSSKRVNELTEEQVLKIREFIDSNHKVEGDLRREVSVNIKRLVDLACYRGSRHKKKLPVRGQRTQCNARTRKGKAIAIAGKKLTPLKK